MGAKKKTNSLKNPFVRFLSWLMWIEIDNPPKWVMRASDRFRVSYGRKCGHPPYNKVACFKGNNFVYRVEYRNYEQGTIYEHYFVKKR